MKTDFYVKIVLAIFFLHAISCKQSKAIPAFARKYQISCQVCHSPAIPRLKGFGDEFASNGFRMTDYESPRYYIPVGDDKLSLFRELPLAVRIDGFASYNFNNDGRVEFGSPLVMKLLSGGELAEKLSYYFYFLFNESGAVAGVEDAFIVYNDLFSTGVNFYIGQFQASDPLFKSELRYTLEPYKIYEAKPGNSLASLKYERGVMLEKGFESGTSVLAEIVNGNGIGEAGEGFAFDTDKHKNYLIRLSQDVGQKLSIGAFAYTGKEELKDRTGLFLNEILMYGPDMELNLNDVFVLSLQYVRRTDSRSYLETTNQLKRDVLTQGGFAEIIFSPKGDASNWYLTGLLNLVRSDMDNLDYKTATLHAGYLLRRNFRIVTEYTHDFTGKAYGRLSAGFVAAF